MILSSSEIFVVLLLWLRHLLVTLLTAIVFKFHPDIQAYHKPEAGKIYSAEKTRNVDDLILSYQ